jgi:hypothetical protein
MRDKMEAQKITTENPNQQPMILSDVALARRLERAEAQSNADFVEARAIFSRKRRGVDRGGRSLRDVRRRDIPVDSDLWPWSV